MSKDIIFNALNSYCGAEVSSTQGINNLRKDIAANYLNHRFETPTRVLFIHPFKSGGTTVGHMARQTDERFTEFTYRVIWSFFSILQCTYQACWVPWTSHNMWCSWLETNFRSLKEGCTNHSWLDRHIWRRERVQQEVKIWLLACTSVPWSGSSLHFAISLALFS